MFRRALLEDIKTGVKSRVQLSYFSEICLKKSIEQQMLIWKIVLDLKQFSWTIKKLIIIISF